MAALITTLIDKRDNKSIIRDQIAGILKLESEGQQALAQAAAMESWLWDLRVFTERSTPWASYLGAIPDRDRAPQVVNVDWESMSYDAGKSDLHQRQQGTGVFNVDCYGYGQTRPDPAGGTIHGDLDARRAAEHTLCLVRNILMSAHYTYLGMRGTVARRWPESEQAQDLPVEDTENAIHVAVARLRLHVDFPEFAPQVELTPVDAVFVTVKRSETGEIYLEAEYP